jgi:hypothetical protein
MVWFRFSIAAVLLSASFFYTAAVAGAVCVDGATATACNDDDDDANTNNNEQQPKLDEGSLPPKKKPNVVILFADNLAYNDVGAFRTATSSGSGSGNERSRTPRTDQLANDGLKLLHWNSPAVLCSASRAGLMTGKYSVRTGIYPGVFKPDAEFGLLANETVRLLTPRIH